MEGSWLSLLVLIVWASGVCAQVTPRGLGETLTVQCEYPKEHKNRGKIWCKETTSNMCVDLVQTQATSSFMPFMTLASGRTKIRDNKQRQEISVMVEKLIPADSGAYWCGVDSKGQVDVMKRIVLQVSDGLPAVVIQRGPGQTLTVLCDYPETYEEDWKTWRREKWRSSWDPIVTTAKGASTPATDSAVRTRIQDNQKSHVISVTVEKLAEEDTGKYLFTADLEYRYIHIKEIELQVSYGVLPEVIVRAPGDTVTVWCAYPAEYVQYWKTWCRETISDTCNPILRKTTSSSGRITILDSQKERRIVVTIEKLTKEDAGVYWCGVHLTGRVWIAKRFELQVFNDARSTSNYTPTPANTQTPTLDSGTASSQPENNRELDHHIIYICVGLGVLILITFIALFYVLWIRRRRMHRLKDDSDTDGRTLSAGQVVPPKRANSENESSFNEVDSHEVKYASLTHHGGGDGDPTYSNVGFSRRLAANSENVEYASLNL